MLLIYLLAALSCGGRCCIACVCFQRWACSWILVPWYLLFYFCHSFVQYCWCRLSQLSFLVLFCKLFKIKYLHKHCDCLFLTVQQWWSCSFTFLILETSYLQYLQYLFNFFLQVWFSETNKEKRQAVGHTIHYIKVIVPEKDPDLLGTDRMVKITATSKWHVEGHVLQWETNNCSCLFGLYEVREFLNSCNSDCGIFLIRHFCMGSDTRIAGDVRCNVVKRRFGF